MKKYEFSAAIKVIRREMETIGQQIKDLEEKRDNLSEARQALITKELEENQ